jgi:PQQ-dependent dehydrogenase (methanol/ethanol family)
MTVAVAALALVVLGSVVGHGRLVRAAAKPVAAAANVDWPHFGNNTDNTHYSPLTQVNTSNVDKLGIAWTMQEGKNLSTWETDPVVVGGTMYLTTNTDQVIAVNAATGAVRWKYTPKVNFYKAIAGGGGGVPTNRGVTVANGTVYLLTFDDQLIALDAFSGEKLWRTTVANSNSGYSESAPATYYNGMLFLGAAEGDAGLHGLVAAYNAANGRQLWRTFMVPADGQGWMPKIGQHGGGDVWMPPTVDTRTGIVYVGTGNPSPDFDNSRRPGCNPHVDSVVAMQARTGRILWAQTQLCPDVWDYDSLQSPLLFSLQKNGQTIRAVGEGNKEGHYWVYNARTGQVISRSPAVAPETLPRPKPTVKGVKVCPGTNGGMEFSPPAYSPMARAIFQPGVNSCMVFTLQPQDDTNAHKRGTIDLGGSFTPFGPRFGTMTAIDPATGRFLWHLRIPGPMIGGALATAGNLALSGSDDGRFYAFDARTGKILFQPNLGLPFGAAPIAYAVNGTEYIAIAVGGSSGAAALSGKPAGATLVVFKLNGARIHTLPVVASSGTASPSQLPNLSGYKQVAPGMFSNARSHDVVLKVVAAQTAANSGFNFDGYAKGAANFIVPRAWGVTIEFTNTSRIPHRLAIASNLKVPPTLPSFALGPPETPNPLAGISAGKLQLVSFTAVHAGSYFMVCLVPGHLQSGMWDRFTISTTATSPSIMAK